MKNNSVLPILGKTCKARLANSSIIFFLLFIILITVACDSKKVELSELSLEALIQKASDGDASAQAHLGTRYLKGINVPVNFGEAARWYLLAAEQGDAESLNGLGYLYLTGSGLTKDELKAAEYFELAAQQGHPKAQTNLAVMLMKGIGVPVDAPRAIELFTLASNQGFAEAQYNLGLEYLTGEAVEKDESESFRWLLMAAQQKHPMSCVYVSSFYIDGVVVEQNAVEACRWLECAAAADPDPHRTKIHFAMCKINVMGGEADIQMALNLLRESARLGSGQASYELGLLYFSGTGVEKSKDEAIEWMRQASNLGYSEADSFLEKYDLPRSQRDFINVVNSYRDEKVSKLKSAKNELQRDDLLNDIQDLKVKSIFEGSTSVSNWRGRVDTIEETLGGMYLRFWVNVSPNIYLSHGGESLNPGDQVYDAIYDMQVGDEVLFSGQFQRQDQVLSGLIANIFSPRDQSVYLAVVFGNLELDQWYSNFTFKFTSIRKIETDQESTNDKQ